MRRVQTLFSALIVTAHVGACGSAPPPERGNAPLDLDGWTGERAAPAQPSPEPEPAAPIELADGDRFLSLVALTRVELPPQPDTPADQPSATRCSLYSIRATTGGLEEGNVEVTCPAGGLAEVDGARIPFRPVADVRSAHLRLALAGAAASAMAADPSPGRERVEVRLSTARASTSAVVPSPPWPPPGEEEQEQPRGSPPVHIGELWEAVMFPGRYAPVPTVAARAPETD